MDSKQSKETKSPPCLTVQELGILHLTRDFQRDFPSHPCTNFDDYECLLHLTRNEARHAVAHLIALGLIDDAASGAYILTCDALRLFDRGLLGAQTEFMVTELRDEREA